MKSRISIRITKITKSIKIARYILVKLNSSSMMSSLQRLPLLISTLKGRVTKSSLAPS